MSQTTERQFLWLNGSFLWFAWGTGSRANSPEKASPFTFDPKPARVIEAKVRRPVDIGIHRFRFLFGRREDLRQRPNHHHNPNQDGKTQEDQYCQGSLTAGIIGPKEKVNKYAGHIRTKLNFAYSSPAMGTNV